MEPLHKYLWLWMIVGTLLLTALIICFFIIINKCISNSSSAKRDDFTGRNNKYTERGTPPLPPRNQYLTTVSESYENLQTCHQEPQYCEVDVLSLTLGAQTPQSYESFLGKQSEDEQPDYVKLVESELVSSRLSNDSSNDSSNDYDYDDVGVVGEEEEDEDYDDVG